MLVAALLVSLSTFIIGYSLGEDRGYDKCISVELDPNYDCTCKLKE